MSNLDGIPLSDQAKFRQNGINKIKDFFNFEIQERKTMSKKLSKYITASDYINNILIVLFATSGGISIISFTSVIGIPAGIASASFTLIFSLTTGIIKKFIESNKEKKKKHNKILMLAYSYSIETLMSQALIDLDISHEEFKTTVNEKEKYEQMKENIRNTKTRDELSENSRDIRENSGMYRFKKYIYFLFCVCKMVDISRKAREKWCRSNSL